MKATENIVVLHFRKLPKGVRKANHYFGSIAAIFSRFSRDDIGATKETLWKQRITQDRAFDNEICSIRKDILIRRKQKKE